MKGLKEQLVSGRRFNVASPKYEACKPLSCNVRFKVEALKMEAVYSSETLVCTYKFTQC
jgi:hypothetical protein